MEREDKSGFSLQTGTDSFVSRSHDVFASLGALEDKHKAFLKATASSRDRDESSLIKHDPGDEDDEFSNNSGRESRDPWDIGSHRRLPYDTRKMDYETRNRSRSPSRDNDKGQTEEQSFKKPSRPPQKQNGQNVPDYRKHPEKYTHYSLRDISDTDMSERSNQRAAFDFLEDRKRLREQQKLLAGCNEEDQKFDADNSACSQGKITFSQPKLCKKQTHDPEKGTRGSLEGASRKLNSQSANADDDNGDDDDDDDDGNAAVTGVDDNSEDIEAETAPKESEVEGSHSERQGSSAVFKSRKSVKRHIRAKDKNEDSD